MSRASFRPAVRRRLARLAALAAAIATTAIAAGLLAGAPGAQEPPNPNLPTCANQEVGAPGPSGNVLSVDPGAGIDGVMLYRDGQGIRVFSIYPPFYRDPSREVICSGAAPTVTNVDRVEVIPRESAPKALIVNQSGERLAIPDGPVVPANPGGPLAPGATSEPRGSEIEISVAPASRRAGGTSVWFIGGPADDRVTAGRLSAGGVGLNLNVSADGPSPDVDVFGGTASYGVVIRGFAGDDRLGARGGPRFAAGLWRKAAVVIQGGTGDDRLFGHPGYDTLVGDRGDDLIRAGRGSDGFRGGTALVDGPGRDRVYGGPGRDELGDPTTSHDGSHGADHMFGGPGADTFFERDGAKDVLNCGPGLEQDVQFDRFDVLRGCTSRQYQRP